jgi:hypothetical protein
MINKFKIPTYIRALYQLKRKEFYAIQTGHADDGLTTGRTKTA